MQIITARTSMTTTKTPNFFNYLLLSYPYVIFLPFKFEKVGSSMCTLNSIIS